ncbi:MAG: SurA N-terminal domain-containing protein [Kiritimatiellae bacterium]|nr:SurA N-terminal domain-containing protein [Kiritimatiellia bacterium]
MVIQKFNRIIRNKWIWGAFAFAISGFFAFDFLLTGGDVRENTAVAGELNGEEIPVSKFSRFSEDVRGFGRARNSSLSNADVNRAAWENLAAYAVAEKLGMVAGSEEIRQSVMRQFSGNGAGFDMAMYEKILRENGLTPEMFEDAEKRRITLMKLRMLLADFSRMVSQMELDTAINDVTDKLTVRIVRFADKAKSAPKLDDKALKAYYDENTNSIALPDCVTVRYVKYQADTPARLKQFKISEDEMKDHYDATLDRFETQTTNGVVTKKFEEVKDIIEKELQLIASVEAYRTNLLFRAYPSDAKADDKASRLDQIAKEDNMKVRKTPRFALDGSRYVPGFMSRPSAFAPGVPTFLEAVAELDPQSADLRYGVVAGTNAVYLIERDSFVKAHVPSFNEAKGLIRGNAAADAKQKAFKASVDKIRALAAAELAKGKPFDAKLFGDANVSTSITFSVSSMGSNAFADSTYVAAPAMRLEKGQISDFISTSVAGQGLVVYLEDRTPGDAAEAQMVRSQIRNELGQANAIEFASAWNKWNLSRMNVKPGAGASMEESKDDGEVSDY